MNSLKQNDEVTSVDYIIHMAILTVLGIAHSSLNDPTKAAMLKTYLLETRDAINALYPDDAQPPANGSTIDQAPAPSAPDQSTTPPAQ